MPAVEDGSKPPWPSEAIIERYTHRNMLRDTHHWHDGIRLGLTRRTFLLGGTMLGLSAYTTVPITGRWQFMLIGQDQELALGA